MFAQTCRKNLIAIISAYRRATGESLEVVSKRFYGNRNFFGDFISGRKPLKGSRRRLVASISIDKFESVVTAFAKEWPEGADRPIIHVVVIPWPPRQKTIVHAKIHANTSRNRGESARTRAHELPPR